MKILILGKGWLGSILDINLQKMGHEIISTTTDGREGLKFILGEDGLDLSLVDLIICTISNQKSLKTVKEKLLDQISLNPELIFKPFIYLSTIGVYGECRGIALEENEVFPSKRAQQSYETEKLIQRKLSSYTILRLGGLLGPNREASNFFEDKELMLNSKAPINLIHSDDIVSAISLILINPLKNEIYNLVSDDHRSREDFYIPIMGNHFINVDGLGKDFKVVSSAKFTSQYGLHFCSDLVSKYYRDI